MTPLLVARGLAKSFGARVAVHDLSLELRPGETFALVGPNGAGKTTTLRMLAGLIAPSHGQVELNGRALSPESAGWARRQVGILTEAPGLWDRLSVRQNLTVYARLYGLASPVAAVDAALERFGVLDRAKDPAAQLSKGLRQRVALARALIHSPPVVLLDEPTSGLDPESARGLRELVRALESEGRAVLICTHNLDEVDRLAARVAVLRTRLLAVDTPDALRARFFETRVRVRVTGDPGPHAAWLRAAGIADVRVENGALSIALDGSPVRSTPELVRLLVEAGALVEEVGREAPSLEQVYLRVIGETRP
jgi:ABC-2 type transport system ATP-binding protein